MKTLNMKNEILALNQIERYLGWHKNTMNLDNFFEIMLEYFVENPKIKINKDLLSLNSEFIKDDLLLIEKELRKTSRGSIFFD
jgi:hypothetical protein